jgi:hypothetical protein
MAAAARGGTLDDLREFYERYIEAFNARDADAFTACFHLPVTIWPLVSRRRDGDTTPRTVTTADELWPRLPDTWTRSTIDEVRVVADDAAFTSRAGLAERTDRRPALQVTVTRWAGDEPYEQVHVLYLLAHRQDRLGITAMIPLAIAGRG